MNWAWATSLDQVWRSPAFPMWLTLAAAGFFGIIVLITLLRAEKSVANGALTVITLLAIGIAVAATIRGFGPTGGGGASAETRSPLHGEYLAAGAVMHRRSGGGNRFGGLREGVVRFRRIGRRGGVLCGVPDHAADRARRRRRANRNMTPELQALRRSVERDRFGLVAQVLLARDHCTPSECAAFRALTDRTRSWPTWTSASMTA